MGNFWVVYSHKLKVGYTFKLKVGLTFKLKVSLTFVKVDYPKVIHLRLSITILLYLLYYTLVPLNMWDQFTGNEFEAIMSIINNTMYVVLIFRVNL